MAWQAGAPAGRAGIGGRGGGLGRAAALCGAVALAAALTGCGGDGGGDSKPSDASSSGSKAVTATPSAPARSKAPADPDAAEKAAVLKSYTAMWVEQEKAYGKASLEGTDVERYATLDALSKFELDLAQMKKAGTVAKGELVHDAKVTGLDLDAKVPKATLSDCVDISKWNTIETSTGKVIPLPTNQPKRYVAYAKAERWDGRWMVTDFTPPGGPEC